MSLPPRPRLVLRAGFAGRRKLGSDDERRLETVLREVLRIIGHRLAEIAPCEQREQHAEERVSGFYSEECPLLRLVTGLCEGADAIAARVFETIDVDSGSVPHGSNAAPRRRLETELAAVVPFDLDAYRKSRPSSFQPEFDRQLRTCAWVLALDGIYDKPSPDTPVAKNRRGRAYRGQSSFLLRNADLLIAAADPEEPSKAGGTLETVREALALDLPVVFIHTRTGAVTLIEPEDDFASVQSLPPPTPDVWWLRLRSWVSQIVADPDSLFDPNDPALRAREEALALMREYFHHPDVPRWNAARGKRKPTKREGAWTRFEKHFRGDHKEKSDTPLEPYATYRSRGSGLSRHYAGLYRGAFLLNYGLAIVAVLLAVVSLFIILIVAMQAGGILQASQGVGHDPSHGEVVHGHPTYAPAWLLLTLLTLAAAKLALLVFIATNTRKAKTEQWNDRAVDYRYLAERLRAMFYLPRIGSFQPPAAAPPQFASRAIRQSAVDWLFDAIVRSVSPAAMPFATDALIDAHDGHDPIPVRLLTLDAKGRVESLRDDWIEIQADYHERNAKTMDRMASWVKKRGERLSSWVVVVVIADLLLVIVELREAVPPALHTLAQIATPVLIATSALLPAVVAALNGVRFQSECQRLAERSAVMGVLLHGRGAASRHGSPATQPPEPAPIQGRAKQADELHQRIVAATTDSDSDSNSDSDSDTDSDADPGSWSFDALHLTEIVATDFVQEAAEWSVLYAQELPEPG